MARTNIYTFAIIIFIGLLMLVGGYSWYTARQSRITTTYTNQTYGVSFRYPKNLKLVEHPLAEGSSTGMMITLTEKGIAIPRDGEEPTAITVAMHDGAPRRAGTSTPAQVWIATSPYSNFKLSQMRAPGKTQIGEQDGYLYTWDGLYQGTTVVTEHAGNIFSFTVTYDSETDLAKREAFTALVESVEFLEPQTAATSTETR